MGSVCHLLESFPIAGAAGPAAALLRAQHATLRMTTLSWLASPQIGHGELALLLCYETAFGCQNAIAE